MKKIDLEILDIALSGSSSGAYALVLGEVNGTRKLPIVIGGAEAQSIAIELENMSRVALDARFDEKYDICVWDGGHRGVHS